MLQRINEPDFEINVREVKIIHLKYKFVYYKKG